MKILGVIPARFASTRFPGKPLAVIQGISMIQRVYNQCKKSDALHDVVVATEDERIYQHVLSFGGKVIMTGDHHQSGTDRIGEVISHSDFNADVVINIQGDEPFINPSQIDALAELFKSDDTQIASLMKRIGPDEDPMNPNLVKVVVSDSNNALYFSRSAIPYQRNKTFVSPYYKHLGIYAYRTSTLLQLIKLPVGKLELTESLEQLRWIEAGYPIKLMETENETIAIDTPEDLERVEKMMKS